MADVVVPLSKIVTWQQTASYASAGYIVCQEQMAKVPSAAAKAAWLEAANVYKGVYSRISGDPAPDLGAYIQRLTIADGLASKARAMSGGATTTVPVQASSGAVTAAPWPPPSGGGIMDILQQDPLGLGIPIWMIAAGGVAIFYVMDGKKGRRRSPRRRRRR